MYHRLPNHFQPQTAVDDKISHVFIKVANNEIELTLTDASPTLRILAWRDFRRLRHLFTLTSFLSPLCSATTTTPRCAAPTIRTTRTSASCAEMPASSSLKCLLCQKGPVLLVRTFTLRRPHSHTVGCTHARRSTDTRAVYAFAQRESSRRWHALNISCTFLCRHDSEPMQSQPGGSVNTVYTVVQL